MNMGSGAFALKGKGIIVDPDQGVYGLVVDKGPRLEQLSALPSFSAAVDLGAQTLVVAPIHKDTLQVLRNFGIDTVGAEPFNWEYNIPLVEGQYEPMKHQKETAAFLSVNPRSYCTSTMRTGKTYSAIIGMDYLQTKAYQTGAGIGGCLIIATVSNMTNVWKHTIDTTLPYRSCVIVHDKSGKQGRLRKLKERANYYIINYDGVKMVEDELVQMVKEGRINSCIIDEMTHYGNPSSQRWKALNKILNGDEPLKYVWGLTGTPGKDPRPYYGYMKLITPAALPCKTLTAWKGITEYRYGEAVYQVAPKPGIMDKITKMMQPTIRYDKKEIMDLPPVVHMVKTCELSKEQEVAYKAIREKMVFLNEQGGTVEAVNKAALTNKLFQISLGQAITTEGEQLSFNHQNRIDAIVETIEEAENKTVIFCPYTKTIDTLVSVLREKGYATEFVDGRITGPQRDKIFHSFQADDMIKVLICHPQTTAFGVELSAASTIIFNGPPMSGQFIYEQALERLSSLKQTAQQVMIVKIVCTKEEEVFFKGLDDGVDQNAIINKIFASMNKSG